MVKSFCRRSLLCNVVLFPQLHEFGTSGGQILYQSRDAGITRVSTSRSPKVCNRGTCEPFCVVVDIEVPRLRVAEHTPDEVARGWLPGGEVVEERACQAVPGQ